VVVEIGEQPQPARLAPIHQPPPGHQPLPDIEQQLVVPADHDPGVGFGAHR
jgi:hypothetical protein